MLENYVSLVNLRNDIEQKQGKKYSVYLYQKNCSCGTADTYCAQHGRQLDKDSRKTFSNYIEMRTYLDELAEPRKFYGFQVCKINKFADVRWRDEGTL